VDVFSCGDSDPQEALRVFRSALAPQREQITTTTRGRALS
jgi:S-adenosylmethionine/arginine decarboxylase-like enzyme